MRSDHPWVPDATDHLTAKRSLHVLFEATEIVAEFGSRLVVEWVVRIRLQEEEDESHDYVSDVQDRFPVGAEDVEADVAVGVDIRVVNGRVAVHYGRLIRVFVRDAHRKVELGTHPDGVLLSTQVHRESKHHDICGVDTHLDEIGLV